MKKENKYATIKIAAILSTVPFILSLAPFAGYLAADLLRQKFNAPYYWYYLLSALGLLSGIMESFRVIKFAMRILSKEQ
jgi:hypothetical protein